MFVDATNLTKTFKELSTQRTRQPGYYTEFIRRLREELAKIPSNTEDLAMKYALSLSKALDQTVGYYNAISKDNDPIYERYKSCLYSSITRLLHTWYMLFTKKKLNPFSNDDLSGILYQRLTSGKLKPTTVADFWKNLFSAIMPVEFTDNQCLKHYSDVFKDKKDGYRNWMYTYFSFLAETNKSSNATIIPKFVSKRMEDYLIGINTKHMLENPDTVTFFKRKLTCKFSQLGDVTLEVPVMKLDTLQYAKTKPHYNAKVKTINANKGYKQTKPAKPGKFSPKGKFEKLNKPFKPSAKPFSPKPRLEAKPVKKEVTIRVKKSRKVAVSQTAA